MTEKEFRKLRAKDLVQLLLTQGGEASQLQEQIDKKGEELAALLEDNDDLKIKLDDRDAYIENLKKDLDQRDIQIRDLEREFDTLRNDLWIDMPEIGTLREAIQILDRIFETAQREADQHIQYAKEQGINPNKVRVARPAMPMTAMPHSSASANADVKPAVEVHPEPKQELQEEPEPDLAAAVSETKKLAEDLAAVVPEVELALDLAAVVPGTESAIEVAAATEPEKPTEDLAAAATKPEKPAEDLVEVVPEAEPEKPIEDLAAAVAEPEKPAEDSTTVIPEAEPAIEVAAAAPKPAATKTMSAIDRFAAESKAAFESEQRVSAIDRLTAGNRAAEEEQPFLIAKAVAAAAAAIEEGGQSALTLKEKGARDSNLVIPPAVQAESMEQDISEPQPFAASPASSASHANGKETHGKKQRKGLFGFMRSGKDKSKKDMDRYESSPMIARIKN